MNRYLKEFKEEITVPNKKLTDIENSIRNKSKELEQLRIGYGQAELLESGEIASELYNNIKALTNEIENLQTKKEILKNINNENTLKHIADKLKQENLKRIKELSDKKQKSIDKALLIEQEYNERVNENNLEIKKCVDEMYLLASEVGQVLEYTDYTEKQKKIIEVYGVDRIFTIERIV